MYSAEERDRAIRHVVEGLRQGTPMTILCGEEGMPGYSTFRRWMDEDETLSGEIARARDEGWDKIAQSCLAIADDGTNDTLVTRQGEMPNREWIDRSKLRVHTRLELLKRWDPKRYGDLLKHAGANAGDLKLVIASEDAAL